MPKEAKKPIRVAYDILRMSAGGANGGIKTHHYEFLRHFSEHHAHELQLLVFCQSEVVEELKFLTANPLNQIHVHGARSDYEFRDSDGQNPPLHFWPEIPDNLIKKLGVDVLYAGFGFSTLYDPDIPQVSLIVDVLHRAYPESLPPEEVAFRDKWYAEELQKSTLVQTNSEYCKQQLVDEFGANPEKIFTIALPLHGRFNRVEMGTLPDALRGLEHKYFLYPANYWPHKNHETALVAFQKLVHEQDQKDTYLALSGEISEQSEKIIKISNSLGLFGKVFFLGKLPDHEYKALWENAKALFFPSLYEGFGIPILEALYFQKPIYASNLNIFKEILGNSLSSFDPRKPLEIASTLSSPPNKVEFQRLEFFDINIETTKLYQKLRTVLSQQ